MKKIMEITSRHPIAMSIATIIVELALITLFSIIISMGIHIPTTVLSLFVVIVALIGVNVIVSFKAFLVRRNYKMTKQNIAGTIAGILLVVVGGLVGMWFFRFDLFLPLPISHGGFAVIILILAFVGFIAALIEDYFKTVNH